MHYNVLFFSMDRLSVLEIIKKVNPWFVDNQVPQLQLESFKRREFEGLKNDLVRLEFATLIIGARRVGKSVLMYQLINDLLHTGVSGKRILFIPGDNPILTEFASGGGLLRSVIDLYEQFVLEKKFQDIEQPIYIFVDEAQDIDEWEKEVKSIIDQKYKVKFIVTGSSSFKLRRGSQNPLAGRITIKNIAPFSFSDFLRYDLSTELQQEFTKEILPISGAFKEALLEGNVDNLFNLAQRASKYSDKFTIRKRFEQYLYFGGFPWVVANKNTPDFTRYLRDLLTTTISKDIMTQFEIRESQSFERLMVNLCLMLGTPTKYKNLGDVLGIDGRIVAKYIDYYVESHWVSISSPHMFHNKPDSANSEKKIYILDNGVINTLAFKDETDFARDRRHKGYILENTIHNHLLSFKYSYSGFFQSTIPYWHDPETNKEIDYIFEIKGGIVPIEAKLKIDNDSNDSIPIAEFLKKYDSAKFGILTSEDTLKLENRICTMPNELVALLL